MKGKYTFFITGFAIILIVLSYKAFDILGDDTSRKSYNKEKQLSGAGIALNQWSFERAFPGDKVNTQKYYSAFLEKKLFEENPKTQLTGEWESLGPENVGGRMLSLAFHPTNPDIIYAGSASGGLWKTTTQGVGQNSWDYIPIEFPVLGVSAIAIDQNDPDILFLGTGETYGVEFAEPGTINRYTRGTYGIGILKSVNGGNSWTHVLQFDMNSIKGVQDIVINPQNSMEVFAATTDGIYRSTNGGDNWSLVFSQPNCRDIEINPNNSDIIYVSQGNFNFNLNPNLNGIFKSTNGGDTFTKLLDPGLLDAWSGTAKLALDPSDSNTIYASIQVGYFNTGPTTPAGVYKSTNAGQNWTKINDQNIAQYQGWYSHDIAVNPSNPSEIVYVGIDAWKSINSGNNFIKKSDWQLWPFGEFNVSQPVGGPDYVHADIHEVYYHPLINNKVFYATDGGIFSSEDGGETFITLNGGLQTGQFYANMASSATDPNFCIAGSQDNSTYIYKGSPSWFRVIGGDGMSAAVNQDNDQIVYGSAQQLFLQRSTNGGNNFLNISPNLVSGDLAAFSAPFEITPSDQETLYAGTMYLYRSDNGGNNWSATTSQPVNNGNVITKIAVSPTNPDTVFIAVAPDPGGTFGDTPKLLKSTDGGENFLILTGLPNRICKDIEVDPTNSDVVYAVFSGFGTNHVFKSVNGGNNWTAIDNNLPDVPTNTILIDPLNSDDLYVGNDLGVYYSPTGGNIWEPFDLGLPEPTMIYDLNTSPVNRKIRVATHGHGIWQRDFVNDFLNISNQQSFSVSIYPNPVETILFIDSPNKKINKLTVYSMNGSKMLEVEEETLNKLNVSALRPGVYLLEIISEKNKNIQKFIKK